MASSSMLLSLALLLASFSVGVLADGGRLMQTSLYMYETTSGPNATLLATVPPKGKSTFGMIGLLDDELLDGPYPGTSNIIGRFQGLVAYAGQVSPPGMQSAISFIFTSGRYKGSTLVMMGTIVSFEGSFERAIVGGTGLFRMARGYCIIKSVWSPTPVSTVYAVNLYVRMEANQLVMKADA